MKKSLKVLYSFLAFLSIGNCSECNNFVHKDKYGGDGDMDEKLFVEYFSKNCSHDFESLIKNFGKPAIFYEFYPRSRDNEIYHVYEEKYLNSRSDDKFLFDLLNIDPKNKLVFTPDNEKAKNKVFKKMRIMQEYEKEIQDLKELVNKSMGNTGAGNPLDNPEVKEKLNKIKNLVEKYDYLKLPTHELYSFSGLIENPIELHNVEITNFNSTTNIKGSDNSYTSQTTWELSYNTIGSDKPYIRLHKFYWQNIYKINGQNIGNIKENGNYIKINLDKNTTSFKLEFYDKDLTFGSSDLYARLRLDPIPKEFMINKKSSIYVNLCDGLFMTYRWPYLKKNNVTKSYEYKQSEKNSVGIDIICDCGISKEELCKTRVELTYKDSNKSLKHIEGAMPIYNGPYVNKHSIVSGGINGNTSVYNSTNLPDQNYKKHSIENEVFDQEFFIDGIKSNSLSVIFDDLELIQDIEDRYYTGFDGQKMIDFGETSNNILKIYANRILNEIFHLDQNACSCTKVAALSQFVYRWMTYKEHSETHKMNPVDIFTRREGICVDYTHLLMGLCSSIGINNIGKISGVGCSRLDFGEKHAWMLCYCSECKHTYEFDPTWNFCYQTGPEHIYLSKTHRVNDCIDKATDSDSMVKIPKVGFIINGKTEPVTIKE